MLHSTSSPGTQVLKVIFIIFGVKGILFLTFIFLMVIALLGMFVAFETQFPPITEWWWPVDGYFEISSVFGPRIHPITGISQIHNAIDIPGPDGIPISAVADGIVSLATTLGNYGEFVMIEHGEIGYQSRYAHLLEGSIQVNEGDLVKQGQVIGLMGNSGVSTGTHLHLEIWKYDNRVFPRPLNPIMVFGESTYRNRKAAEAIKDLGLEYNDTNTTEVRLVITKVFPVRIVELQDEYTFAKQELFGLALIEEDWEDEVWYLIEGDDGEFIEVSDIETGTNYLGLVFELELKANKGASDWELGDYNLIEQEPYDPEDPLAYLLSYRPPHWP